MVIMVVDVVVDVIVVVDVEGAVVRQEIYQKCAIPV